VGADERSSYSAVTAPLLRRSLAARLTAAFLSLSVGVVIVATFASYREAESALRDRLRDRLEAFAIEDAGELATWLERHRNTLIFLASLRATQEAAVTGDVTALAAVLRELDRSSFSASEILLARTPGGRVSYSTVPASVGDFVVEQLYYAQGRAETFTQQIYPDGRTGRPTLTVSTPVRDAAGVTRAVLAAHLDLHEMETAIAKLSGGVPIDAYLVNSFAEFVSAERFGRPEHRRGIHSIAIDSALAGGHGSGLYADYDGRPVVGAWRWLPDHRLALVLESPQDLAFAPARELLAVSLVVGLLAALLLTFGIVAITRRLTSPILEVAAAAERVADGDFTVSARVRSYDEVGLLATAFNAMTARLRTVYGELGAQVIATRQALTEAQVSRALLQDVVDNATTLVIVVGLDGGIRLANARVSTIAGVPPERLLGARLAELPGTLGAALSPTIKRARETNAAVEGEIELGAASDIHTWQTVAFPLRGDNGETYAIGVVATDLTERARAEEERRAADASVQQLQKLESLGIMAGGIAHDFNNILGAILGNVELAQTVQDDPTEDQEQVRAEVRESLSQIAAAARRASELTRQMLAYAGRASLRREVLDVRRVLADIVPLVRASQSKLIELAVEPMPDPLWIEADPSQVSQVALNLLTNAAEAMGERAGQVKLSAVLDGPPSAVDHEPAPAHHGSWVRVSVEDTGEGMSDEVQARIFDPFYTTKSAGRGLGLSAVRGIIRSTGGVLRLVSTPGQGTRFDVYLPAVGTPSIIVEPPSVTPTGRRAGTVLIVDDEESLRRVARRALEMHGLKVLEAEDGAQGLERYRQYEDVISLVVLDITMPLMGGIELLTEIRRMNPALPAIIASGYDRADELASTLPDRHTRFLQKPFTIAQLREAAEELLKRSR